VNKDLGVVIIGATGYGAGELLRLLLNHSRAEVVGLISSSNAGACVGDAHPQLEGLYDLKLSSTIDFSLLSRYRRAVVFAGLPHGVSATAISGLLSDLPEDLKASDRFTLIDLSGDFRIKDLSVHEQFYSASSLFPEIRSEFVYGLSELNRKSIETARLISNPGCFATACILAAAPMVASGACSKIIFDAKTGISGAGRSVTEVTHFPSRYSNFSAYKVLEHRHEPEIVEGLSLAGSGHLETTFIPHLLPVSRGIFVTAHMSLDRDVPQELLEQSYKGFYAGCPFVRVRSVSPEIGHVIGTNFFDVSVKVRGKDVVVMGALDNLVKGMAGQAIQNMNLACGLDQRDGLWHGPIFP